MALFVGRECVVATYSQLPQKRVPVGVIIHYLVVVVLVIGTLVDCR